MSIFNEEEKKQILKEQYTNFIIGQGILKGKNFTEHKYIMENIEIKICAY